MVCLPPSRIKTARALHNSVGYYSFAADYLRENCSYSKITYLANCKSPRLSFPRKRESMKPLKGLDFCFCRNDDLLSFGRNSKVSELWFTIRIDRLLRMIFRHRNLEGIAIGGTGRRKDEVFHPVFNHDGELWISSGCIPRRLRRRRTDSPLRYPDACVGEVHLLLKFGKSSFLRIP